MVVSAAARELYQKLPEGTWQKAQESFVYSAAIATLLSFGDVNLGLQMAAVAYTASLVDTVASAVLRPYVLSYFKTETLPWYLNYTKLAVSLTLNNYLCGDFLIQKIGIAFTLATSFMIDVLKGLPNYDLSKPTMVRNYRWVYLMSALVNFFKLSEVELVRWWMNLL